MRHVLIEVAHLAGGLLAVGLLTEAAAWAYPPGHTAVTWIGWIVAVAVMLWSIPLFRAAWARDREHD